MAARANSLTERVTKPVKRRRATCGACRPATFERSWMTLGRLGYDVDCAAGVGRPSRLTDLNDPDARIPCEALGTILSSRAAAALHAEPRARARTRSRRSARIRCSTISWSRRTPSARACGSSRDTAARRQSGRCSSPRRGRRPDSLSMARRRGAVQRRISRRADGPALPHTRPTGASRVTSVSFQHTPDDAGGVRTRARAAPFVAASSWSGLTVPLDAWRLPLRRRDPVLRHMLESHADEILARLSPTGGLALDVQRALTPEWSRGDARIGALARQLAMSGRTLQRRLAAEGVSYQELARRRAQGGVGTIHQRADAGDLRGRVSGGLFGAGAVSSRVQAMVRDHPGASSGRHTGSAPIRTTVVSMRSPSLPR